MIRMNRKIEYALMVLKVMSLKNPGQLVSAKEVTEITGSPFDATAKVMQQMAQAELLRSEQGVHGGYSIARDLNKISLFDLNKIILGPVELVKCLHEEQDCQLSGNCNIQSPLASFNRRLTDFFLSITLSDLLKIKAKDDLPQRMTP